jgi:chromate reductase
MHLLGISGSLRSGSFNTRLLASAADHVPEGWTFAMPELLRDVPPFDVDAEDSAPEPVARVREHIAGADAILIATPEYNSSIPGQLKNVLDWVSRPYATNALRSRPVAVISASTTPFGGMWAAAELRKVLARTGARVVEGGVALPEAAEAFGPDGRLLDPELDQALAAAVAALAAEARAGTVASG